MRPSRSSKAMMSLSSRALPVDLVKCSIKAKSRDAPPPPSPLVLPGSAGDAVQRGGNPGTRARCLPGAPRGRRPEAEPDQWMDAPQYRTCRGGGFMI